MRRTLAAVVLVCVSSCSLALTRSPDLSNPPASLGKCSTDRDIPKVDTGFAITLVGVSLVTLGEALGPEPAESRVTYIPVILTAAALGTLEIVSAYLGFKRTRACIDARRKYDYASYRFPPDPPSVAPVGEETGPCTDSMTCNPGLVCAIRPGHQNRCVVAPPPPPVPVGVVEGGPCTPQLTCFRGLVCAAQPDGTNRCVAP